MKKIDPGQAISVVANFGVIAGIIFLAVELQQNNALLTAQARAEREVVRREANNRYLENPELIRVTVKASKGEPLTEEEAVLLDFANRGILWDWQFIVREFRIGLLEGGVIPSGIWAELFPEQPGLAEYWSNNPGYFEPDFIDWMEENVVNER